MLAAIAEFERDLIRERTRDGLDAARAQGNNGGRRPGLTERQAAEARRMYNSREYTVTQIAGMFRVSRQTIYRHLGGGHRQFTIGAAADRHGCRAHVRAPVKQHSDVAGRDQLVRFAPARPDSNGSDQRCAAVERCLR